MATGKREVTKILDQFEIIGESASNEEEAGPVSSRSMSDEPQKESGVWGSVRGTWDIRARQRAEEFLKEQGFDDTDGDGLLNWPAGSPFGGENVDLEIIVSESAGVAIGFVPIAGDVVEGAALVIGKDPFTGECLTQTEQILLAIGIILVLPISIKGVKLIGKQSPLVKRLLVNSLSDLPVSVSVRRWSVPVRLWLVSGSVHPRFTRMRTIAGEGAIAADEMASSLGLAAFSKNNYRKALLKFTGVSENAAKGLEAHHVLPQKFEETFLKHGIETIHDPRLLVWVGDQPWSKAYNDAWKKFFEETPNPTKSDILAEAQELAPEFGYEVLFKTAN